MFCPSHFHSFSPQTSALLHQIDRNQQVVGGFPIMTRIISNPQMLTYPPSKQVPRRPTRCHRRCYHRIPMAIQPSHNLPTTRVSLHSHHSPRLDNTASPWHSPLTLREATVTRPSKIQRPQNRNRQRRSFRLLGKSAKDPHPKLRPLPLRRPVHRS